MLSRCWRKLRKTSPFHSSADGPPAMRSARIGWLSPEHLRKRSIHERLSPFHALTVPQIPRTPERTCGSSRRARAATLKRVRHSVPRPQRYCSNSSTSWSTEAYCRKPRLGSATASAWPRRSLAPSNDRRISHTACETRGPHASPGPLSAASSATANPAVRAKDLHAALPRRLAGTQSASLAEKARVSGMP